MFCVAGFLLIGLLFSSACNSIHAADAWQDTQKHSPSRRLKGKYMLRMQGVCGEASRCSAAAAVFESALELELEEHSPVNISYLRNAAACPGATMPI